jgi:putative SOS response-associated peptidase YedK
VFESRRGHQPSPAEAGFGWLTPLLGPAKAGFGWLTPQTGMTSMCGKFTQLLSWYKTADPATLWKKIGTDAVETVTPMRPASVISLDAAGVRRAMRMRWGLLPQAVRDPAAVKPHIHARAETLDRKPAFREAFLSRRGLVAVTSFNEGRDLGRGKSEQHELVSGDGKPLAIAVVWEQGAPLASFAMVTVPPSDLIATITDRMPALIEEADWPLWLGEVPAPAGAAKALLRPSARSLSMSLAVKPKKQDGQQELF